MTGNGANSIFCIGILHQIAIQILIQISCTRYFTIIERVSTPILPIEFAIELTIEFPVEFPITGSLEVSLFSVASEIGIVCYVKS